MPVLFVRLTVILSLFLAVIGLALWGDRETVRAASRIQWTCPPCGKELTTDLELRTFGDRRWAVCSEACFAKVRANASSYRSQAIE